MQSSNYSQTSSQACDTEGQETDLLECCRCNQQVEQILALQCDHNLCLGCASHIVRQWSEQYEIEQNFPSLRCEICFVCTQVDPSAIMILRQMSQSQTHLNPHWQHSSQSRQDSSVKQLESSDYVQLSKQEPDMFQSLQQVQTKIKKTNQFCQQHNNEIAILYCFTCQCLCFCMECYLAGMHKNHDVKNVQKSFNQFKSSQVEQIWFKMKSTSDVLQKDQCGFSDKKLELINIANQAKYQIKQSFDDIYSVIAKKEQELLQAADEIIQQKLQDYDNEINKLKQIADTLEQFDKNFTNLFQNQYQSDDSQQIIESFNYVSINKKKIEHIMENFTNNRIMQNQNLQIQFSLDPSSIQNQLEEIKSVRLLISSLRGVETNYPTSKEKEVFEKAKEERRKRLFNNIVQDNQKIPNDLSAKIYTDNKPNLHFNNDSTSRQKDMMQMFSQKTSTQIQVKENNEKKENITFSQIKRSINEAQQQYSIQAKSQDEIFDFKKNFKEAKKQICERIR